MLGGRPPRPQQPPPPFPLPSPWRCAGEGGGGRGGSGGAVCRWCTVGTWFLLWVWWWGDA